MVAAIESMLSVDFTDKIKTSFKNMQSMESMMTIRPIKYLEHIM